MTALVIISLLLAVAFVVLVVWSNRELPDSISALVYSLPKGQQWLWTLWLWAASLLVCIPLIDALPDAWRFLSFLTLAYLGFTGAMPIIYEQQRTAHNILGTSAGILSQLCVAIISPWWLLLWLLFAGMVAARAFPDVAWCDRLTRYTLGKEVFVAEAICALAVYGALIVTI